MKRFLIAIALLGLLAITHSLMATTIYEVQHNETNQGSGNNCYPSPLVGQTVAISGVVTAVKSGSYPNFWMEDASDGLWNGIYVYDASVSPSRGDSVTITAKVYEYYGMTEMKEVSSFTIHSNDNPLPDTIEISTGTLAGGCSATAEAYEGLLVRVNDVVVTQTVDQYGQWYVDDGSDECQIEDGLFHYEPDLGDTIGAIVGVVTYSYSEYEINPRDMDDIIPVEPVIRSVRRYPYVPQTGEGVLVKAVITDDVGISSVSLTYTVNHTDSTTLSMTPATGDTFETTIPGQSNDADLVEFQIKATDVAKSHTTYSYINGYFVGTTPIGYIRVNDANGDNIYWNYGVRVTGVATVATGTFAEGYVDIYLQDNSGGVNIFSFYDTLSVVNRGDSLEVVGRIAQYYGKVEVVSIKDVPFITHLGSGTLPEPQVITVSQLSESYEGVLVAISYVSSTGDSTWPAAGENGNFAITDSSLADTVIMRIDKETDIDEWGEPPWPKDVVGICTQFDRTSPYTEGYQLTPRNTLDFQPAGSVGVVQSLSQSSLPSGFSLSQNYPNPFNPVTQIFFSLPERAEVHLAVYNIIGQKVAELVNGKLDAGSYRASWDAKGFTSGIYFSRLRAGANEKVIKMILLK